MACEHRRLVNDDVGMGGGWRCDACGAKPRRREGHGTFGEELAKNYEPETFFCDDRPLGSLNPLDVRHAELLLERFRDGFENDDVAKAIQTVLANSDSLRREAEERLTAMTEMQAAVDETLRELKPGKIRYDEYRKTWNRLGIAAVKFRKLLGQS